MTSLMKAAENAAKVVATWSKAKQAYANRMTQGEHIAIDRRAIRAEQFATQIMQIIWHLVEDKAGVRARLVDAAYQADVEIVPANGEVK